MPKKEPFSTRYRFIGAYAKYDVAINAAGIYLPAPMVKTLIDVMQALESGIDLNIQEISDIKAKNYDLWNAMLREDNAEPEI